MSHEISLISCDYRIKLQNIVWIQKKISPRGGPATRYKRAYSSDLPKTLFLQSICRRSKMCQLWGHRATWCSKDVGGWRQDLWLDYRRYCLLIHQRCQIATISTFQFTQVQIMRLYKGWWISLQMEQEFAIATPPAQGSISGTGAFKILALPKK